jgi:pyrroline-5-carboxylate reductase
MNEEQQQIVKQVCNELGTTFFISEEELNAYTVAFSCEPAYAFVYLEAVLKSIISMGISPEIAKQ